MKLSTFALKFFAFVLTVAIAFPLFRFLVLPRLGLTWIAILLALAGGVCVVLFVSGTLLRKALAVASDPRSVVLEK